MSFHVPEFARDTTHPIFRTTTADGNNGAFDLESSEPGWRLKLICADSSSAAVFHSGSALTKWEHVSVHAYRRRGGGQTQLRTPIWDEMCYVKRLCWDEDDVVMQLHPRQSQYVNCHPHVLHLWRPLDAVIPEPPSIFVGPKPGEVLA